MLRTRDYAVMLGIIAFLLCAIVVVGVKGFLPNVFEGATAFVASEHDSPTTAIIPEEKELSRDERVKDLAAKVAAYLKNTKELNQVSEEATSTPDLPPKEHTADVAELRCSTYRYVGSDWNPVGLKVEEVEGARIVYRERIVVASSTESTSNREILLQLPLRSSSQGVQNCIGSDVIGVTVGGALIKNTEVALYSGFASDALIGYALDGYPIYGASTDKTDVCGGRTAAGQYRYQISTKQKTIINCYAGTPVSM